MNRKTMCWVDRGSSIVVRGNRAVRLGFLQFAIFDTLHSRGVKNAKKINASTLADRIYDGTTNPSTTQTIRATVSNTNRKLGRLGLRIRGVNRGKNSFYQIVVL